MSGVTGKPNRSVTPKALLAGLAGAMWISVGSTPVDDAFKVTGYLIGTFFPVGVTAYMLFLVLAWNPFWLGLAGRVWGVPWARRLGFSARELTLIFGLTIVSCWAPASGLFRYFHRQNVMPWVHAMTASPNWQAPLATLPAKLFPDGLDGRDLPPDDPGGRRLVYDRVYIGLSQGLPELQEPRHAWSGLLAWPWRHWLGAMAYWGPLLALFAAATVAMMLAVHRQWSVHEQLAYPLAKINASLLDRDDRHILPATMRDRLFWWGFGFSFLFYAWNYLSLWYSDIFPEIPTGWMIHTWELIPEMHRPGHLFNLGAFTFAIIGIAYFLASEVGLTLGVAQLLLSFVGMQYYFATGGLITSDQQAGMRMGGYAAYALVLLYTGRAWYGRIAAKALGVGRPDPVDRDSVWAARSFGLAVAATWLMLWLGFAMDPLLAGVFLLFMFTTTLVVARLVCETGLPFLQLSPRMLDPLVRLLGYPATGLRGAMYMNHLYSILSEDHRETLSPYVAQGLHVGDRPGRRMPLFALGLLGSIALSLVAAFVMRGHGYYSQGSSRDVHAYTNVPAAMMAEPLRVAQRIQAGLLEDRGDAGPLDRLLSLRPERGTAGPVAAGMAMTLLLAALRFRFNWFMLHPLLVLAWGTYPMFITTHCFLIGWAIKSLVLQFGGGRVYQRGKPLIIGLIMGEAAAVAVSIPIGMLYYWLKGFLTNTPPKVLMVFPV